MQLADCLFPTTFIDEIIPVGDQIVYRASGLAERHTAIHASRTLLAELFFGEILVDLEPVVYAFEYRPARSQLAGVVHEAGGLTHVAPALRWLKRQLVRL